LRLNIQYKITIIFCLMLAVIFTGVFFYLDGVFKRNTFNRIRTALVKEALLVKMFLEKDFPGYPRLQEVDSMVDEAGYALDSRVTIIALDGAVLGDSELDEDGIRSVENHLYRPEVQQALKGGVGESVRFSTTVKRNMLYVAAVFGRDGPEGIVRLALSLADVDAVSDRLKGVLLVSLSGAFLLTVLASFVASFFISKPLREMADAAGKIAEGDFSRRITIRANDEVGDLAKAFTNMAEQVKKRMDEVIRGRSRFEAVLLSMFDGVMVVDAKGRILLMNPTLMQSLRLSDNPAGKKPVEVFRNVEVEEITDSVLDVKGGVETREIIIQIPNEKVLLVHATPIIREDEAEGAVLLFHDVTELKRLEQIRRDFVANVSHELRTPISSIKGYAETLIDGAVDDKELAEEFVGIIQAEADRLAKLIEDLLDLSRLESGKLDLHPVRCSVKDIAERVIRDQKEAAGEKSIAVREDIPEDIPDIMADPAMITQVLINLMDNAIKYTPEGGGIEVSAAPEGGMVEVRVTDTGVGIPEKDLSRIFERFYRVDKARSRQLGGTGLGLSIVKHIVQEHGGQVWVDSLPGKGSTFTFTLPRA